MVTMSTAYVSIALALIQMASSYKVSLFTSKSCRQCSRFDKVFTRLTEEYPRIPFTKVYLTEGGDGVERAMRLKIDKVPMVVFENDGDEEEARLTGVPSNYDEIGTLCENFSDRTLLASDGEKNCSWVVINMDSDAPDAPAVLTHDHLRLVRQCESVYSDDFMRSAEAHVENNTTDTQCTISTDLENRQLVVCFRGSDSSTDWRMNFFTTLSEFPYKSGRYVHAGFLAQWMSVASEFEHKLVGMLDRHRDDIDEVIFCGHSAGTVSCLAAYEMEPILKEKYEDKRIRVVTFGAPRMGNDKFRDHMEERVDCTRIVLDRDVITRVPFSIFGYEHIGRPLQIREDCILQRDTSLMEALHWVTMGIPRADFGVRDHFIFNYRAAIEEWLGTNKTE